MTMHRESEPGERLGGSDGRERPASVRSADAVERIREALGGLRYGSVLAIVQDGVVVQIERTEKTRLVK